MEKIFFAMMVVLAVSLTCYYDEEPYFENEYSVTIPIVNYEIIKPSTIDWLCTSDYSNYTCNSYIIDNVTTLQVNPESFYLEGFGIVDKYYSAGRLVRVSFEAEPNNVRAGINYTFKIACSSTSGYEQFNTTINPQYREPDSIVDRVIHSKENATYVIGAFLLLGLVALIMFSWYRFIK